MNQFLRTGVKLGKKIGLLDVLMKNDGKMTIAGLATETKMMENLVYEYANFLYAANLCSFGSGGKIILSSQLRNMENVSNLKAVKELEEMYSIIEQCFLGSKLGYTYDEFPVVFDYIRKTRQRTLQATIQELVSLIKKHLGRTNIGHVLDAACGSGDVAFHLPSEFGSNVKVHGCDISVKAIEEAQTSAFFAKGYANLSYSIQDLLALPGSWDKKFDVVLLFDVLHDMGNRDKALQNAIRVLKDDGLLVIVDPKVSSNIFANGNNSQAAIALLYSILWCIPTACCSNAHGVGWGFENKDELMTKHNLQVVDRRELMGSPFDFAYFAKKILK